MGVSTDTRFAGAKPASGNGLEFSEGSWLVVEGSTAPSSPSPSPATTPFCSSGAEVDFLSSFAESVVSAFDGFSALLLASREGEGIGIRSRSFTSVCAAEGGAGTTLRAGARLGTGGAPCGAGEAVLEDARGAGEPALDRLGTRGEPGRCNICAETREGKGAGETTRSRGRGGDDVDADGNAGDVGVGVSGRGTVWGETGRSDCITGGWGRVCGDGGCGSTETDSLIGLGRAKVIESTGVVNDS